MSNATGGTTPTPFFASPFGIALIGVLGVIAGALLTPIATELLTE